MVSVGYGNQAAGMGETLIAMRDAAIADTTYLNFLRQCRIAIGAVHAIFTEPTMLLIPVRSIENRIGQSGKSRAKYAVHEVNILCCKFSPDPFNIDDEIIGNTNEIGLIGFHEHAMGFFGGIDLGLTGLNAEYPPEVESEADPYNQFVLENPDGQTTWMICSSISFMAYTSPFER